MGNLDVSSYTPIVWALPLLIVASIGMSWLPRSLNLLTLGPIGAAARGAASAFAGAAFLVTCDVAARTLMSPLELPVGVITAILGGPFFLWLLVRAK